MRNVILCFWFLCSVLLGSESSFVTPDLLQLLEVMEVPHDGTPASIAAAVATRWARPAGKERWEVEDTLTMAQREAVFHFCRQQHFFDEVVPTQKKYDYALILGGTVGRMAKRIDHFVRLVKAGFEFGEVILLAGARPLDSRIEIFPEGCKTEGDALFDLWKAQNLSKEFNCQLFEAPMMFSSDGQSRRPTTADTYIHWLSTDPVPGSCLIFSNQPYCHYQNAVAQLFIPKEFAIETIGFMAEPSAQNGLVLLDTIAAWISHEVKRTTSY